LNERTSLGAAAPDGDGDGRRRRQRTEPVCGPDPSSRRRERCGLLQAPNQTLAHGLIPQNLTELVLPGKSIEDSLVLEGRAIEPAIVGRGESFGDVAREKGLEVGLHGRPSPVPW
jgi:hypothetical protein